MRVTRLKLANVRAIEAAEFRFRPGFNLVVGVNGVGKTTVLDALAVCLSDFVRRTNRLRKYRVGFDLGDMRMGADALDVECDIQSGKENARYSYVLHTTRESSVPRKGKEGMPREQMQATPARAEFVGDSPNAANGDEQEGKPLAILFSTNRAVPSDWALAKSAAAGGVNAAFSVALSKGRGLRLREFEAWMRVQEALGEERPAAKRALAAFQAAVTRFLPGYRNPRLGGESISGSFLLVDRGDTTLPVELLSDGERGMLAMVLDLTRRLAQANPAMDDPAASAEAVVLIDEIELHLHPGWQRRIVKNLIETFPKCQFIATTHSPQVIGEVEHDHIHIMANGEVYPPPYSFGVDSNRVLEEIMDSPPRAKGIQNTLSEISSEISKQRYDAARSQLAKLESVLGENDPEVIRIGTLLDFLEGKGVRNIQKGCEPQSLTKHRMDSHSYFHNYRDKNTLRQALVSEQRGLCCYCMGRIHPNTNSMKIEHWRSRAQYPGEQLKYQNLLGACPGGQGQPASKQYCDTNKGDRDLKWNPSNRAHNVEALVRYESDGSIRANDVDFNHQIDRVLNLNLAALKNNRNNVLNAVLDWWRHEKERIGGSVPRSRFIRQRNQQVAGNRPLQPYCQVAVWWLDQRLARMAR